MDIENFVGTKNERSEMLASVEKLARDTILLCANMGRREAKILVSTYYMLQKNRVRTNLRMLALQKAGEKVEYLPWLKAQQHLLENQIKKSLDVFSQSSELGLWMRGIVGCGPVITAGFLAYIDVQRSPYAGNLYSYAGLSPASRWEKKKKCPWNRELKTLCYKLGESFVKTKNRDGSYYGPIFDRVKQRYIAMNERGDYADEALHIAASDTFEEDTDAIKWYRGTWVNSTRLNPKNPNGEELPLLPRLPPAQIHARARRVVAKLFLSHYHQVAWKKLHGVDVPPPYPMGVLKHDWSQLVRAPDFTGEFAEQDDIEIDDPTE